MGRLQDLLIAELEDLYSAEKQILKALPGFVREAQSQELKTAFSEHLQVTKAHVTRLEEAFAAAGRKARVKHCKGMEGLLAEGGEYRESVIAGPLRDLALIGAARRVEHYEIAAYGSARAIAEKCGVQNCTALLAQTLKEEESSDKTLRQVAQGIYKTLKPAARGNNSPFWSESIKLAGFPAIARNISVDTLVIGGGLMGVTTAYLLSKAGQKVALIEREQIASGDTSKTTAHLTAAMDMRLTDMIKTFGDTGARALWDAGDAALHQIAEIANQCGIDCDLSTVPGYLHLPGTGDGAGLSQLQSDAEVASRLEIPAELVQRIPFFDTPGIRFANQARFHPTKYIAGLLNELRKLGCALFENTKAEEFSGDGKIIKSGKFKIHASKTIIATHTPIMGNSGLISATLFQTKIYLYTSYAVCAGIPKNSIPDCLFWDTLDPYNYIRLQTGKEIDYVIYGGKDHKTGQADDTEGVFSALEEQLKALLSKHKIAGKIVSRWSGQVIETNDGAPFIGESTENQFAATGFSGNGMTFGTLSAMMAADWVLGRKNPWTDLLSPSRKKIVGGILDYIKENIDFPYYMVKDRLRAAEGISVTEVKAGEGKILKLDGERVAVYRGPTGDLVKLSPICTHLGCVINWNDAESTWDCPCHGSRFHATGEVMSGPAEAPLDRK